jgi:microcin C transport system substrate-binding protein
LAHENVARNWATGYCFPAVKDQRVVLEEFQIRNVGVMQAFAFNTRRSKFSDPRLRRAFNFDFDFESINRDIFYGQYRRIASYFQGTELACSGLPEGQELNILTPLRNQVPAEVFTSPYWNPLGGGPASDRRNLLEAMSLLEAAGFAVRNLKLVESKTGEPVKVEFLLSDPTYERFVLSYQDSHARLGIDSTVRTVDSIQYENRLRNFDFDVVVASWEESLTPGNELRDYFGSSAAVAPGSRNLVGIADKAIDQLIDRIIYAGDRAEQVAATHALDRVLLWHHYVVPQWTLNEARTARWNRYNKPDHMRSTACPPSPISGGGTRSSPRRPTAQPESDCAGAPAHSRAVTCHGSMRSSLVIGYLIEIMECGLELRVISFADELGLDWCRICGLDLWDRRMRRA